MTRQDPPLGPINPLCAFLDKPPADFRKEDFLRVIKEKGIERLTFHYTALDGRLKELAIPVTGHRQAEQVLAEGERVDGSSLFPGVVEQASSDLYVVPEYKTAFLNPFDECSLDFICRYITREGLRAPFAQDTILHKAHALFRDATGLDLHALGELEFFLIYPAEADIFPMEKQQGYHEASPFRKGGRMLAEMVARISRITGAVKYGHSEVGFLHRIQSDVEEIKGKNAEQLEVEMLPLPAEQAADAVVLARWIVRNVAFRHGCVVTFAPKIELGVAGNGLHFHLQLQKESKNVMVDGNGSLSEPARRLISALCRHASSLTAFGNTVASSYLRLIPHYEAPTRVCWSDLNRDALVRVPLAWKEAQGLADVVNPGSGTGSPAAEDRQTVEFRSPDGSAHVHLLLAGITLAAVEAFEDDASLASAEEYYMGSPASGAKADLDRFPSLPSNCAQSARALAEERNLYQRDGVFPSRIIDYLVGKLEEEGARMVKLQGPVDMRKLMHRYIHVR